MVSQPTSIIDIYPTILDYLQLDMPTEMEGVSLLPWLEGEETEESRGIVYELEEEESPHLQSLLSWPWRLIRRVGGDELWLFNLQDDPIEANNLANQSDEKTAELLEKLNSWLSRTKRFKYDRKEHRWTEEGRQRLKALGYL